MEKSTNKHTKKKDNKSENKGNKFLTIVFCILGAMISRGLVRSCMQSTGIHRSHQTVQQQVNQAKDAAAKKFDSFNSSEELLKYAAEQVKNSNDTCTPINVFNGFVLSADALRNYCLDSGYIPTKLINSIKSYEKGHDVNTEFKNCLNAQIHNEEASSLMATAVNDMLNKQLIRSFEEDYQKLVASEGNISKQAYCKILDEFSNQIVEEKIKSIRDTSPKTYELYFKK